MLLGSSISAHAEPMLNMMNIMINATPQSLPPLTPNNASKHVEMDGCSTMEALVRVLGVFGWSWRRGMCGA